jgi:hypothetical protein
MQQHMPVQISVTDRIGSMGGNEKLEGSFCYRKHHLLHGIDVEAAEMHKSLYSESNKYVIASCAAL